MNHGQRAFAALLVLLGGASATNAQPPHAQPGGYPGGAPYGGPGFGAPGHGGPGYGVPGHGAPGFGGMAPQGGPMGMPTGVPGPEGWGGPMGAPRGPAAFGAFGGPGMVPAPQEALYNHYTGGGPGAPGPGGAGPGKLPPDPFGPQRFHMPIPSRNDDFAGGNERNIHTRPDERSIGPRLDTSYTFFRECEVGYYGSEHQHVLATALSFLPLQTPCWIVGARAGLAYNANTGITNDHIGATTDLFWGTRFGHTYFKIGYFVDWTSDFRNHGVTTSVLTKLGPLGNITFDGAFASGAGNDIFTTQNEIGIFRRAEIADTDTQVRVGKFLSPYFQTGLSGAWTNYRRVDNEFSGGLFANWFVGRTTISAEATGGTSGLRGYLVLGFNWGGAANIDAHPIDPYYDTPIDTTSWVTRATRRDITMKIRESETGSGPPQNVPIILD